MVEGIGMDMDMGGGAPIPSMDGAKLESIAEAAPSPDFSMWTAEDDYLLKNNMEAGAAMEALAKGAVRFSHRFTLRELRERWGALLYDPEVSAQASAQMVRFGNFIAGTAKGARHTRKKDSLEAAHKRKLNSVRTHYYRMRKRIAVDQVPILPFPNGPNGTTAEEDLNHPSHLNNKKPSEDDVFEQDAATGFWLGKGDDAANDIESSMLSFLAEVGAEGDVGAISVDPEKIAEEEDVKPLITFDMDMATITAPPTNNTSSGEITLNMASQDTTKPSEEKLFEVPENPVESQKSEAIHEAIDMTPSLPSPVKEGDPHLVGQTSQLSPMKVEIVDEIAKGTLPEQDLSDSEFMQDEKDEVRVTINTDKMICVLNTEDTEIPSPPPYYMDSPPSPLYSPVQSGFDEKNSSFSAGSEGTHKVKRPMQSNYLGFSASQGFRRGGLMQTSTGEALLGLHTDAKCSAEASHLIPSPHLNKAYQHTGKAEIEVQLSADNGCIQLACSAVGALEDELENTCVLGLHEAELAPSANAFNQNELAIPWQAMNSQGSEQDLKNGVAVGINSAGDAVTFQNSQFECYESEDEMVNFSDVEAMILDMDLEPMEEEELSARAESRKLYKHHRKTIAMLEHCANASLQRSLSSRGAIAVIYGRHLKYYITKNEVTLGRGTQDNVVDIDLGKEGRANKVSRRQAIIKLKDDGVFDLNNLGRRTITVNNAPVRTSQRANLWSNCLIEIGGMYFIFDTSRKLVKQRLEQMLQARNYG